MDDPLRLPGGLGGEPLALEDLEIIGFPEDDQKKAREYAEEQNDAKPEPCLDGLLHRTMISCSFFGGAKPSSCWATRSMRPGALSEASSRRSRLFSCCSTCSSRAASEVSYPREMIW